MRQIILLLFVLCLMFHSKAQNEVSVSPERFNQYLSELQEIELPSFCFFFSEGYIALKDVPFVLLILPIEEELMDIGCYTKDGRFVDHLIVRQHYFRDHVAVTEDGTLRVIDNLSTEEDPQWVENRYRVDASGQICFIEQINYRELARPWVEENRKRRKEELERFTVRLEQAKPAEANELYDYVFTYFTPISFTGWMNCVDTLNFSNGDITEYNRDFWSSLKSDLYYYLDSAEYVSLNHTFYHQLFAPYVTEDYKEALRLYIIDDYELEGEEELLVDREDIANTIIERERYAAQYPTSKHTTWLLRGCPSYLRAFLFSEGVNTSTFENRDNRKIIDDVLEFILTLEKQYPDTRLGDVFRFFLSELKKTNNCYIDELKETVMKYVDEKYTDINNLKI
ncbi:hypothetical protein M2459_000349 [Parabacteroides sp. PF5-5]|uniref:hypothetical protein n=1 Tax=unclassified Parabacteroides TaxID=2649774 RepID=UPI002475D3F4|nr:MULTISPECIES: hypothetical protein [unclassified Parabacteroides]MDH6306362.1 hypothetical protein [Parabacteroides sp. PH5-39]MDH6314634.1 hypothetical protein [Parabacteroides sp. PF5-13]MDH6321073.1 hypothetical protein [Parabacteroides sp. PH5-13]MDH6324805.1 hypothetical protein [Parabacteroides sp. PH5-8]MDH6325514.1 hypothetical protein [Parabacteroides sp. PH5-41]